MVRATVRQRRCVLAGVIWVLSLTWFLVMRVMVWLSFRQARRIWRSKWARGERS